MVESINELRAICQPQKMDTRYRKLSIYLTKLFLKTPFSADAVTFLDLVIGLIGTYFLSCGSSLSILFGALFLQLYFILDCVDGEIARYTKTASIRGKCLEKIVHFIVNPLIFISLGFGIFNVSNDSIVFFWAFLASFGSLLNNLVVMEAELCVLSQKTETTAVCNSGDFTGVGIAKQAPFKHLMRLTMFFYQIYTVVGLILLAAVIQFILPLFGYLFPIPADLNFVLPILIFYGIFFTITLMARILVISKSLKYILESIKTDSEV